MSFFFEFVFLDVRVPWNSHLFWHLSSSDLRVPWNLGPRKESAELPEASTGSSKSKKPEVFVKQRHSAKRCKPGKHAPKKIRSA